MRKNPEFQPRAEVARARGSKAGTPAGIIRATTDLTEERSRVEAVALQQWQAEKEMSAEFARRKNWGERFDHRSSIYINWREWYRVVPLFARAPIFGSLMPAKVRRYWRGMAGENLNSPDVRRVAYDHCHWGRVRNTTTGGNHPSHYAESSAPQYSTHDMGHYKGTWSSKTAYEYRSRYACIATERQVFVAFPDGTHYLSARTPRGSFRSAIVGWKKTTPPLSPAQQVRAMRRLLDSRTHVAEYDEYPHVIELATGEIFHGRDTDRPDSLVRQSVLAFEQRRIERHLTERNARLDAMIAERGHEVYVALADSVASGNCEVGTLDFAKQISPVASVAPELACTSAAAILATRDDQYTRRACRVAALRYMH